MSKFLKVIVNLVIIAAIVVAAALLIPPFAGVYTVMNDNTETDTNLPVGSVAYERVPVPVNWKSGIVLFIARDPGIIFMRSQI